jgi:hypothetical protein
MAEVSVEAVVGVLAHGAGVEHDDIRGGAVLHPGVSGRVEQAGDPLRVVHVHLAPVGADVVRAAGHVNQATRDQCGRRGVAGLRAGAP